MSRRRRHASTQRGVAPAGPIASRHDALKAHVDAARKGDVTGVHQARVATRRLREVVPVLGAGLRGVRRGWLRRRLRDLTRALGGVRELDVLLAMIADLPLTGSAAGRLRDAWSAQVAGRRRAPVRALRKVLDPAALAPLHERLDALEAAREASPDSRWRKALARQLAVRADTLRDRIERSGALYHPEALHEVRIATKQLRYALELTDETGIARVKATIRTLKSAQDALGRLHDLDVLLASLQAWVEEASSEDLQPVAAEVAAAIEHEARLLHARYLRTRQALVRVTDTTRDRLAPRVTSDPRAQVRPDADAH